LEHGTILAWGVPEPTTPIFTVALGNPYLTREPTYARSSRWCRSTRRSPNVAGVSLPTSVPWTRSLRERAGRNTVPGRTRGTPEGSGRLVLEPAHRPSGLPRTPASGTRASLTHAGWRALPPRGSPMTLFDAAAAAADHSTMRDSSAGSKRLDDLRPLRGSLRLEDRANRPQARACRLRSTARQDGSAISACPRERGARSSRTARSPPGIGAPELGVRAAACPLPVIRRTSLKACPLKAIPARPTPPGAASQRCSEPHLPPNVERVQPASAARSYDRSTTDNDALPCCAATVPSATDGL